MRDKCQATIEDFANGTHYNLSRSLTVPKMRQCSRYARSKLGAFCFCNLHTRLALEGLINERGHVAARASIADVRKYPKKFPGGLYTWVRDLKPADIK